MSLVLRQPRPAGIATIAILGLACAAEPRAPRRTPPRGDTPPAEPSGPSGPPSGSDGDGARDAACSDARRRGTSEGCLFYPVDLDNQDFDDDKGFAIPIGNPGPEPATVRVERRVGAGAGWTAAVSAIVAPGAVEYLSVADSKGSPLDRHVEGTGVAAVAYRISSDRPVVAYQVNSDDTAGASLSSGSTLLLPDHGLGRRYWAISAPHAGDDGQAFIAVVGTHDGTKVRVTAAAATAAGDGMRALARGESLETTLDEGDVLQLETAGPGDDLSGSEIVADQPIAVYAGSVCARIGRLPTASAGHEPGESGCDHAEEALYPVETWGRTFVFPDLRMPLHAPSQAVWGRIVASEDGTVVGFDAPRALPGVPAEPVVLDRGRVFAFEIREPVGPGRHAHLTVTASAPIEMMAFTGVEEGAAVVTPVAQFRDRYLVAIHPWFTGNLFVARKAGVPVVVGGDPLPSDSFVPAGGGFEVAQLEMPRCETELSRCAVEVSGAELGVWVAADGGQCSYAYAGGAGVVCVNRTVPACR